MKVLVIGSDRKLFEANSDVRQRVLKQGEIVDELHIIVFAKKGQGLLRAQIAENVYLYSTESRSRWLYVRDAIQVAEHVRHFDLISAQDPFECGLAAYKIAQKHKVPFQLQLHTDPFASDFATGSTLNAIRKRIAKWLLPRASCVRVVSERVADALKAEGRIGNIPVSVLPVRMELARLLADDEPPAFSLKEKYPQSNFHILMASRLTPEKRIDIALEAFYDIASRYPTVSLVIVGDGPEKRALQSRTKELDLESRVYYEGWQEDLVPYFKTADCYLLSSEFEGFARTLVEAAAAKKPIVSTDVGIVGKVLVPEESCLVCPVGDIECLAHQMARIVGDNALRHKLAINARNAVKDAFKPNDEEYYAAMKQSFVTCLANVAE